MPPPFPGVRPHWQYIFTKCVFSLTLHSVLPPFPFCWSEYKHIESGLHSLCKHYIPSLFFQYSIFFIRSVLPLLSQHSLHQISVLPPSLRPSKVCVPSVSSTQSLLLLSIQSLRTYFSLPPSHFPLLYLPPLCPSLPPSPLPSFTSPPLSPIWRNEHRGVHERRRSN